MCISLDSLRIASPLVLPQTLGPDIPLVTERNGPFVPAGFLEYYPRVSMVSTIVREQCNADFLPDKEHALGSA